MDFNTSYLNRTPNKWPRGSSPLPSHVCWHETASPNPDKPEGTLNYNLNPNVQSSYNYLIARNGTIYHYVSEKDYIAYHAGVKSKAWGYTEWDVNVHSLGVELDGANDGTRVTEAQLQASARLALYFKEQYGISLDPADHLMHKIVAPSHKTDPQGYSPSQILQIAKELDGPPDLQVLGLRSTTTLTQFKAALLRNRAPLANEEMTRIFSMAVWLDIEPAYLIALWIREGGRPLGSSVLQQKSHCPINLKAADGEWRPTVPYKGIKWLAFESFQLGCFASLIHLKNSYGARGLVTLRQIIPVFAPASDGNDVDGYIKSLLEDITYIKGH